MRRRTAPTIRLTTALLWTVGLSPAFSTLVVSKRPKELPGSLGEQYFASDTPPVPWKLAAIDLSVFAAIAVLGGVLVLSVLRTRRTTPRPGAPLAAAGIGMYAAPILSGLVGARGGAWDWRLWFAPLAILALWLAPPVPPAELLRHVRGILRVYTWGSLAALLAAPGWALAPSYIVNFRLPWVGTSRLYGLTDHPILLGVVAVVALAVELAPVHRARLWLPHAAAAATVVLLAQSRTAWITALLSLPFLYRRDVPGRVHPVITRGLLAGLAVSVTAFVPAAVAMAERVMGDKEVTSFHGRTEVWGIAMRVFHSDIVWGYGPTLFLDRSSPVHGKYVHAHGQFFQTLATSGLVGAVSLLLFVAALVVAAARAGAVSNGLSYALVIITLVTCMTEAPLRGLETSNPYLLLVLLDIAVLLAFSDRHERPACSRNSSPTLRVPGPSRTRPASAAGPNWSAASPTSKPCASSTLAGHPPRGTWHRSAPPRWSP